MAKTKVELKLLKDLVKELEESLAAADRITDATEVDNDKFVVEMSKASGLAAGIMQESSMLVMDCYGAIRLSQGPVTKDDGLKDIMSLIKGATKPSGAN